MWVKLRQVGGVDLVCPGRVVRAELDSESLDDAVKNISTESSEGEDEARLWVLEWDGLKHGGVWRKFGSDPRLLLSNLSPGISVFSFLNPLDFGAYFIRARTFPLLSHIHSPFRAVS